MEQNCYSIDKMIKNIKYNVKQTTIGYRDLIPTQLDSLFHADDILIRPTSQSVMQAMLNVWT